MQKIICIFGIIFLSLFLLITVDAQTTNTKTDYTKLTLTQLKTKANNNDVAAQFELGMRYKRGVGVAKDDVNSILWLKKAADNNHAEACGLLGDAYCDEGDTEQGVYFLRKGASLGDGRSYYCLFLAYSYGRYGLPENESIAGEFLIKSAEARFGNFFVIAVAYAHGSKGLPQDKEKAIFWGKKSCDQSYTEFLDTGKMPREGDGWPYLVKWLSELGCDYDPALHVDEFKRWMSEKPVMVSSTQPNITTSPMTTISESYHYTKSGRGQSQNTGQWTDAIGSEECEVTFGDNYITVNGALQSYVRTSGKWKVYGGTSMGWGGSSSTFYYYVDDYKNMMQVSESVMPYGMDTFVYPMSRNGDPTPQIVNTQSYGNSSTQGSSSTNSNNHSSRPSYNNGSHQDCHVCHGSGVCQTCNGRGYVTNYGVKSDCPNCYLQNMRPTGKCSRCQGTGKVFK